MAGQAARKRMTGRITAAVRKGSPRDAQSLKERAYQILTQYRDKLDELADALVTDETVDSVRIAELLGVPAVPAAAPAASGE